MSRSGTVKQELRLKICGVGMAVATIEALVWFCPDHGYISQKTAGQGHFGHFWSLCLI